MKKWEVWLTALQPFTFTTSLISIGLANCLAVKMGEFSWGLLILTLSGVLLLHSGTNLINNYYDYQTGVDTEEEHGSSGVLPAGLLDPKLVKNCGIACFLLVIPIISYLTYLRGPIVLLLTIIGGLGGYFYTARPISYKYYALGVPLVFLLLGPLLTEGSYYVQTGNFNYQVLLASIPVGLLISAILHGNDFRDLDHDARVKIKTLALLLGRKLAGRVYLILVLLPYLLVLGLVIGRIVTPWALFTLGTLPYAVENIKLVRRAVVNPQCSVQKIDLKTAQLHFKFGTILLLAILGANII